MNHAFLILAHNQPQLLKFIVETLNTTNHYFFIHIDKKSSQLLNSKEIKELSKYGNVKIYSFMKVNWGGFNQFYVSLELLKKAIKITPNCNYFHLISGADLPLRKGHDFDVFFEGKEKNYMGLVKKNEALKCKQRLSIYYFRDIIDYRGNILNKYLCLLFENFQNLILNCGMNIRKNLDFEVYKGSNWWSLNRESVMYIIDFCNENPSFIKRFKYTNCYDEIFFHSIIMNSKYKDTIENNNLRYIDWTSRNPKASLPNTLTEKDYMQIKKSGALFCRKIDWNISKELIKIVKNEIYHD